MNIFTHKNQKQKHTQKKQFTNFELHSQLEKLQILLVQDKVL